MKAWRYSELAYHRALDRAYTSYTCAAMTRTCRTLGKTRRRTVDVCCNLVSLLVPVILNLASSIASEFDFMCMYISTSIDDQWSKVANCFLQRKIISALSKIPVCYPDCILGTRLPDCSVHSEVA